MATFQEVLESASSVRRYLLEIEGYDSGQRLRSPTSTEQSSNFTGTHLFVDDNVKDPDEDSMIGSAGTDHSVRYGFAPTGGTLILGEDQQRFRVAWRRTTTGPGDPAEITVELWEAGGLLAVLGTTPSVTTVDNQYVEFTWDATLLSDSTGADVELRILTATLPAGIGVDIRAADWQVKTVGSLSTFYFADGAKGFTTLPTDTPANQHYEGRIIQPPTVRRSMFASETIGGRSIPTFGAITLNNDDGGLDYLADFAFDGRRVVVKMGDGTSFGDFGVVFTGTAEQVLVQQREAEVQLRGDDWSLTQRNIQEELYQGRDSGLFFNPGPPDRVEFGTPALLDLTGDMTFEGWGKFDSAATTNCTMMGWNNNAPTDHPWAVVVNFSTQKIVLQSTSYAPNVSSADSVPLDVWVHIAVTVEGDQVRFYIDSVPDSANPQTASTATRAANNGGELIMSVKSPSGPRMDGSLDDIRVWDHRRTEADIKAHYKGILEGTEDGLLGYWNMDEHTGSTVFDITPNGNDGTIFSAVYTPTLEGTQDLENTPKPLAFGRVFNIEPVLLDARDVTGLIYQYHSRESEAVDEVRDNGVVLTGYTVDLVNSTVTLGTQPVGRITMDVRGDKSGGTWNDNASKAIQAVLLDFAGLSASDLDADSFTALDAITTRMNVYIREHQDIATTVDSMIDAIGGFWGFNRAGKVEVGRFDEPVGPADLVIDQTVILSLERVPAPLPVWRQTVTQRHNYTPQNGDELAGFVTSDPDLAAKFSQPNRAHVAKDESVKDTYLNAQDVTKETLSRGNVAAFQEANRLLALFKVKRDIYRVRTKLLPYAVDVNAVVKLIFDRFDLDGGKLFRVIGFEEDAARNEISMELWG